MTAGAGWLEKEEGQGGMESRGGWREGNWREGRAGGTGGLDRRKWMLFTVVPLLRVV